MILYKIDAEKDEGPELAKAHNVQGYPTFVLANAEGETLDRWLGYGGPDPFIETLSAAVADPTTIDQKFARFREHPTESDAHKLADLRSTQGLYAEAVALYQRARELNPESTAGYDMAIFEAMSRGQRKDLFSVDDLKKQADTAMTAPTSSTADIVQVAMTMGGIARKTKDNDLYIPYLEKAIALTSDVSADDESMTYRKHLLVDHALLIDKNVDEAVAYKKATLPEGWMEDASQLNGFAWWCFENEVNLEEAEKMARRGIELAQPGNERANIYDTLAEICNLTGNCKDAVELIRLALKDDPENEYFQKQLDRFEKLLAQKEG